MKGSTWRVFHQGRDRVCLRVSQDPLSGLSGREQKQGPRELRTVIQEEWGEV